MGFNCGIVGLPNVGKSTLFNALTRTAAAAAENFPFCTIEPNIGRVPVPDPRLAEIAQLSGSCEVVPTFLEFVDIAGLVRGASRGEGLGNRFLANIREVDAVLMVLRCFEDSDVSHVEGSVDPVRDAETVATELMLADLESLERRVESAEKKSRGGDREAASLLITLEPVLAVLRAGQPARAAAVPEAGREALRRLGLLTAKPVLYIANVEEEAATSGNRHSDAVAAMAEREGAPVVVMSAGIEAEIARLESNEERRDFLQSLDLPESGLDRVIQAGYSLLGLLTYHTTGPKETRAWTVPIGTTAAAAAGRIHTDFERGFIAAETISHGDFVACGGEQGACERGRMRREGRNYALQDGDIVLYRFNV